MIGKLRGRSAREIAFRLRQEAFNLLTLAVPPGGFREPPVLPVAGLPPVEKQVAAARGTRFAEEVLRLAEAILARRTPLVGCGEVNPGDPIAWRRDWVHGTESPLVYQRRVPFLDFARAGDHKIVWELSRHQHFVALAQAYRLSGRRGFLRELERQWLDWIGANPYQRGIHWASALEVGFRALSWIWALHLCGEELPAGPLVEALGRHGCYLEHNLSVYFSPNTHLLGEAVALHAVGVVLARDRRAARWRELGARIVAAQLERQVRPDGGHFEQSTYYHLYALDFFLLHYLLADRPAAMRPRLELMAAFLNAMMGPAHHLPLVGDDDGGRVFHPYGEREKFGAATLATCRLLFGGPGWAADRELAAEQAAWWLGEVPGEAPEDGVNDGAAVFPDTGAVVLSPGPWWVLFDAGPFGPGRAGHSHSDTLSVVVRYQGHDVLIDPGTYTYTADPPLRRWFRGSAAHNTLRVDGCDQAIQEGPFGWRGRPETRIEAAGPEGAVAVCEYAGTGGRVRHRRRIEAHPERLVFEDEIDGPPGEHLCEAFWHPAAEAVALSPGCFRVAPGLALRTEPDAVVEPGWRSSVYGRKERAPVVAVRRRGVFPVRFRAVLEVLA